MPSCPRCHANLSTPTTVCPACGARVVGSAAPGAAQLPPLRQAAAKFPARLAALVAVLLIGALLAFALATPLSDVRPTTSASAPLRTGIAYAPFVVTPTIAAQANAQPPKEFAPGAVLLADDFDDPSRSRLLAVQNDTASYAFREGSYAITLKQPQYMARSSLGGSYADIAVEADATLDSGPDDSAAGIVFRYQDDSNFYLYRVSDAGNYSLAVYTDGQQRMLLDWTASPAINPRGRPNKLRVEAVGDQIRLFVNDRLLGEASDSSLGDGEIALAVSTFDQGGATFWFDNLVVRSLR